MKIFAKRDNAVKLKTGDTYTRDFKKNWQLYVLMILPVIYILIFSYGPMYGVLIAFKRYYPSKGILGSPWAGFFYFDQFFNSPWFFRTLFNTLRISFATLLTFPVPIALALCLNVLTSMRLKKLVQMVSYLPHFISTVVMVGMITALLSPRVGLLGRFLYNISGGSINNVMGSTTAFIPVYVISGIWQNTGWSAIVYLSALASVSSDQTEAAIIDGTTRLQRVWYIDLPAILPTVVTLLIIRLGHMLSVGFEKVLLLQNDLNLEVTEIITTYSYKMGLLTGSGNFSFGAAIGLFNSVVNLILLITVNKISKKVSETSLW